MNKSVTIEIDRQQILFAPYNPRKDNDVIVNKLVKNFKQVGFLGGIVWNSKTGFLISGHKRVLSLDKIYKYKGNKETSYKLKVESIELDEKSEIEQNIFMNSSDSQGEFDNFKLASLVKSINFENAGLNIETIELLNIETNVDLSDLLPKKEFVKLSDKYSGDELQQLRQEKRQERREYEEMKNDEKYQNPYFIVIFDDFETKLLICQKYRLNIKEKTIQAKEIFRELQ